MRLMFVYWQLTDAGCAQDIHNYTETARALGHEVVLYAPPDPTGRYTCSLDVASADAVIFLLEWLVHLHHGSRLNLVRLLSQAPRERRIVIDSCGLYNDLIRLADGDSTHPDEAASRRRIELCDSLSDKIYQPTLHPLRPNVRSFLFHGYNPAWEVPLDFRAKEYGMVYVGNNWFRWRPLDRVLRAVEPIRAEVGRIGLVGGGWAPPRDRRHWALTEEAHYTDPAYLRQLGVELMPRVPVEQVISTMSRGVFSPVIVRPMFKHLRLVNPRMFETVAANTIPLFDLEESLVRETYGERAIELRLADDPSEQIADVLRRPEHYAEIVAGIRRHLAEHHSYVSRVSELIEIVRN